MIQSEPPRARSLEPHAVEYGELPELTRALRAFGSARRSGALQSQFFLPLLEARRRAAAARSPRSRVGAFDCEQLTRAIERTLDRIVADWPDDRPAARRALRASLVDLLQPYFTAIRDLSGCAATAVSADESSRLNAWRAWTVQLSATFAAADRSWLAVEPLLLRLNRK
jgi:hypothetical protein